MDCASHASLWEGSTDASGWGGPHTTIQAAIVEWLTQGTYQGFSAGTFRTLADGTVVVETAGTEITSTIGVTRSGLAFSRATQQYVGTITVTNNSGATIAAATQVVFDDLTSGVTLSNASGTTGSTNPTGAGNAFITLGTALAAGESVNVPVRFSNPTAGFVSYTPRFIVAGS